MGELLPAFLVYILIPAAGLIVFLLLIRKIRRGTSEKALELAYFFLFFTLGGWLLIALTAQFFAWSGMASLGMFYLLLVAPFLSTITAYKLRNQRGRSPFHLFAFWGHIALSTTIVVTTSFLFGFPCDSGKA
jgi:hypothetical protein